ncbi:hypothetical protein [Desulfuromonas sp. TF]|uniref:hypothetical protein n=1 Tax=Desulfuromonas sp. TF TaxID=1232410 RepID=UPI000486FE94|nr:hypothetical protein [Desulfuromonas sp. TF]
MLQRTVLSLMVAGVLFAGVGQAVAADPQPTQERAQVTAQEQIYGSQLMTPEERTDFSARMRAATTEEERERIRREHHEQMKERAKQQGITLPEEPPERGMGRGMGPGGGMGGDGMGGGLR